MHLTSMPHVYLRTDLRNTSIESASLAGIGQSSTHTVSSNILAKIPVSFDYINYVAPGTDEFFIYLPQKNIPSIRLFLTDHKGRRLGRSINSTNSLTAAGSGTKQSSIGPLSFTATLRIDSVQRSQPNTIQTPGLPRSIPGRKLGPGFVTSEMTLAE